jgi:hypothetical protein
MSKPTIPHCAVTVTLTAVPTVELDQSEGEIVAALYLSLAKPAADMAVLTALCTSLAVAPATIAARAPSREAPMSVCLT